MAVIIARKCSPNVPKAHRQVGRKHLLHREASPFPPLTVTRKTDHGICAELRLAKETDAERPSSTDGKIAEPNDWRGRHYVACRLHRTRRRAAVKALYRKEFTREDNGKLLQTPTAMKTKHYLISAALTAVTATAATHMAGTGRHESNARVY